MMRYSQPEKMEIIQIVENSVISARRTLNELQVNRSSFYSWYDRYRKSGYEGLSNNRSCPNRFWNKIPYTERQKVISLALDMPEKSPRELAWHITDTEGYFISESSVYRILKSYDLVTSPAYIVMKASDKFKTPTRSVNELWQTDFTYFKITGWGWYYLSSVMDDYSRYIISWKLFTTMSAEDVKETLDIALEKTGVTSVKVKQRPRLLSDNGPCYISGKLKDYLEEHGMSHTRGAPYHPMTQGKIERYHRTMKNVILLQKYYLPWELEREIHRFIEYYNNERYHESINNLIPKDVFYGKGMEILTRRDRIKRRTLELRRKVNLRNSHRIQSNNNVECIKTIY
jgi:transposase InsO family protein